MWPSVSSTQVSRASAQLDVVLQGWRNRLLGIILYLYLDVRYEKMRGDAQIRDVAVLMASGVDLKAKPTILGVSISLIEGEVHWRTFLQSLVPQGHERRVPHHQR
jgi:putative transposase